MALAIATNNAALNAAASASSVNRDMETSMARLSTGKRINSASDDAAGVAIASRLSAEIRGTDQAIRNSLDGQALIDTSEGAHKEIENILQRMREVAVQAANDTNNEQDRGNLQAEMDAMSTEIDRIAGTTTWAGANLMDDETTEFSFQVGAATGSQNQIAVTIDSMNTTGLYMNGGAGGLAARDAVDAVTAVAAQDALTAADNVTGGEDFTSDLMATITSDGDITLKDDDDNVLATASVTLAGTDTENAAAITTAFTSFGVTAAAEGNDEAGIAFTFEAIEEVEAVEAVTARAAIAADVNAITVEAGDGNAADVNARSSIVLIDAAIKQVNVQRSELGAVSNRLNHTVNNLTNISSNLSAAKGGIEDADFALETTNLAKNQILQQASTAMLAQANASKQNVLSLLQG